jgi:hypothetical protein
MPINLIGTYVDLPQAKSPDQTETPKKHAPSTT